MIRVQRVAPPANFDEKVGQPGQAFLDTHPNPTGKQFQIHNYWIRVKSNLYECYSGICAYSCHYISLDTGSDTVEHFVPKSVNPSFAYVWDNYRLVCGRLNGRKGSHQDVLDPFAIEDGMFVLDFPSLLVKPSGNLDQHNTETVLQTISRLKLNDDETSVRARLEYVASYCQQDISFAFLRRSAPFIARELQRQDLVDRISAVMGIEPNN